MSRYFSNGTEGYAWMANWCDRCDKDHQAHIDNHEDGCPIIARSLVLEPDEEIPEWVDLSEEQYRQYGGIVLGDNVHCLAFAPCQACENGGGDDDEPAPGPPPVDPNQLAFPLGDRPLADVVADTFGPVEESVPTGSYL